MTHTMTHSLFDRFCIRILFSNLHLPNLMFDYVTKKGVFITQTGSNQKRIFNEFKGVINLFFNF